MQSHDLEIVISRSDHETQSWERPIKLCWLFGYMRRFDWGEGNKEDFVLCLVCQNVKSPFLFLHTKKDVLSMICHPRHHETLNGIK